MSIFARPFSVSIFKTLPSALSQTVGSVPKTVSQARLSSSFPSSSFDSCFSDGCKTQAGELRSSMSLAGFKQNDETTAWSFYAAMKIEARAKGDDYMTKKLGFLAVAFRDFDVNKSNMLHLEEFRRALSCNHQFLAADQVDKCFEAMGPDANSKITFAQWLDNLPEIAIQRLHLHQNAPKWRAAAKYTDQQSFKAKNLRGRPYIQ